MGRKASRDIRLIRHRAPDVDLVRGRGAAPEVERHAHRSLVLVLPLSGTRECEADGQRFTAGPGQVLVIPPGKVHACPAVLEQDRYLALCVSPDEAAPVLAEAGPGQDGLRAGVLTEPEAAQVLEQLVLALESPAPEGDKRALLREALLLVAGLSGAQAPAGGDDPGAGPGPDAPSAGNPAVGRAVAALSADPLDPPDGEELSRLAGLSPAHLTRLFTRTVGAPPRHFLLWLKVRRARELLDQGAPLAACAAEAGFADQSHMCRAFVRILGLTPGQYAAGNEKGPDRTRGPAPEGPDVDA